ncbi:MAG TPA: isoprenylcysteine carboxylmethyltransferase family protein [Chloroflexi bacterium]|jgi:protein-S-isoprenylcysteine O-methyltransferase Ste14|nr:isoprenylcysteine carboxylmethyltransferase family protein [Chloroflexota bacterium]
MSRIMSSRSFQGSHTVTQVLRSIIVVLFFVLLQSIVLLVAAGRLDWPQAWLYIILNALCAAGGTLLLTAVAPDLVAERGSAGEGVKEWDIPLVLFAARLGPLLMVLAAGLEYRLRGPLSVPVGGVVAGVIAMPVGYGVIMWAMLANRFFSGVVRIQRERGHTVATRGPYRIVRHPGYVGMLIFAPATPLLLGSWWAAIPTALVMVAHIARTALEDRTLQAELEGYAEYARNVRYRLIPGVW